MSDQFDDVTKEALEREFTFDKFVRDLEKRENARREEQRQLPIDHNVANRRRDAQNREHPHNRIRWGK
jgi:hypothetical protein